MMQVNTSAGYLQPIGQPFPIGKLLTGWNREGPVVTHQFMNDNASQLRIYDSKGKLCFNPAIPSGSTKYKCGDYSSSGWSIRPSTSYLSGGTVAKWTYKSYSPRNLFNASDSPVFLNNLLTAYFSSVNILHNIDGNKMLVIGNDTLGYPLSGLLTYPSAGSNTFTWERTPSVGNSVTSCPPPPPQTTPSPAPSPPAVPNGCSNSNFCSQPIDIAIPVRYYDPSAPIYLIQGNCTMQVAVTASGSVQPIGNALPVGQAFTNLPPLPLSGYMILADDGLYIGNAAAQGAGRCAQIPGSSQVACTPGWSGSTGVALRSYYWQNNTQQSWSLSGSMGSTLVCSTTLCSNGNAIPSAYGAGQATAFLNVDGAKMIVFGKDASGAPLTGVLNYPSSPGQSATWFQSTLAGNNIETCGATASSTTTTTPITTTTSPTTSTTIIPLPTTPSTPTTPTTPTTSTTSTTIIPLPITPSTTTTPYTGHPRGYDRCDATYCMTKPATVGYYEVEPCGRNFCKCTSGVGQYLSCAAGKMFDGSSVICKVGNSTWCPTLSPPSGTPSNWPSAPSSLTAMCNAQNCADRLGANTWYTLDLCTPYWCYCTGLSATVQVCSAGKYFDFRSNVASCAAKYTLNWCG
ncbi:hypothetical protein RvY_16153 [Ramazzottius varieornatus]|uniref:Chitin-binding type-2 domain-containing protein n=1 Tax=Ramazzottius varieornatus TaxID=947166 RepID=A0A1D1VXH2_RAMVA|nr:hypothetical protein RvY_16153 [Ramazzottius varieornatus]